MRVIETWGDVLEKSKKYKKKPIVIKAAELKGKVKIFTREGELFGEQGDFLIQGVEGEIYPCGRDIFFKTYDEVEERVNKRTNGMIMDSINKLLGFKTYEEKIKWSSAIKPELLRMEESIIKLKAVSK